MLNRNVVVGDTLKSTVNPYCTWTVISVKGDTVEISNGTAVYPYTQYELKDFMIFVPPNGL